MSCDEQPDKVLQGECPGLSEEVYVVFLSDGRRGEHPISRQVGRKLLCEGDLVVKMARGLAGG